MKKVLFGLVFGMGVMGSAMATDNTGTVIPSGTAIGMATDCTLLSEDVTINLSNGVFGAYACNTTDNVIAVATCHPTGRKGNVSVNCNPTLTATDTGYVANCTALPNETTKGTATVQGGLAFTASSQGGAVQGTNAANCVSGGSTTAEAATAAGL